jgi:hypothetical protein
LRVHRGDGGGDLRKDRIAIVKQVSRRVILRKGIAKLLRRPRRCWMLGDRHVDEPSPVVREHDEHEKQSERGRWHDEKSAATI